jgi:hypothetical protein
VTLRQHTIYQNLRDETEAKMHLELDYPFYVHMTRDRDVHGNAEKLFGNHHDCRGYGKPVLPSNRAFRVQQIRRVLQSCL